MKTIVHPTWSKNAVIYQINLRQFSIEGTLSAARKALSRIKQLGADILWLMPIHPIGIKNRKGTLGSPYSVRDYKDINPEFGTISDLMAFVNHAHTLGMKVILDWVANHTSWDNILVSTHPEWYAHDRKGHFRPTPWWDWADIIELDYSHSELQDYMVNAMLFWVNETDIDGFRCDVAGFVPNLFWQKARAKLEQIKPVFMLAEWESRDLYAHGFDATYAWSWVESVTRIAQQDGDVRLLHKYYSWNEKAYPRNAYRMTHVTNHDLNAWNGTSRARFGDALEAIIVLSVIGEGLPMIYNGQEAGDNKQLLFFDKDPILWTKHPIGALYQALFALKHANIALWNGEYGARMQHVTNTMPLDVFSFVRQHKNHRIFAVFNFSARHQQVNFTDDIFVGKYFEFRQERIISLDADIEIRLAPWQYHVYHWEDPGAA
ncbi:alpha-amylase family glycosyl hydrolase [Aestuariibacter sp. AA17]|uniref:Alpha-amylase family glycosyl hydrolase n=1 Tax=Fluctibacter corallii TaxID=2984329 RepID=A0ABT3A4W3_9ALTE|nr:alpha-amylase family glycosyl hydrolase [Aestuariibacter sp. AA17]MCV2883584.1 alpha-amylase family glycosyl hydrolase [Aestuariibacter sp. AA17]